MLRQELDKPDKYGISTPDVENYQGKLPLIAP